MLYKEINYNAYEIRPGTTNHCFDTCDFLKKEAAAESVEYFNDLKAKKDHLYFLVVAMTSGENFGANRNGDYFKEEDLKKYYKIFESAGVFWNHDNKDPSKSIGKVLRAFWNQTMHRIELVIEVPTDKSRYLKSYIEEGKPVSVSMGLNTPCFVAGTHIQRDDGTSASIETFNPGDKVLTSQGNIKRVEKVTETPYSGNILTIQPKVGNKLVCTPAHKYHVIDFRKLGYNTRTLRLKEIADIIRKENVHKVKEWVMAKDLDPDRHVLTQTTYSSDIEYDSRIDINMARILGYYLSEGHIMKSSDRDGKNEKNIGIILSCHIEDNLLKEIESLASKVNVKVTNLAVFKNNSSKLVRTVHIYSHELAELALFYCGQYAKNKKLSREIFLWPDNLKMNFLGAYADGDGHFSTSKSHYGHLSFSTSSKVLSQQNKALLDSLGIQSSQGRLNHKPSGKAKNTTIEYTNTIGKYGAQSFLGYCSKVFKVKLGNNSSTRKKFIGNTAVQLIKSIESTPFTGNVYDLVIEDDHSFVAEGVNVHNSEVCSICGHTTKGSYANRCEHLKFMMNTVLHDGKKVYAICGTPYKVFDISFVFRPADKIAYAMLTKSASIREDN